MRAHGEEELQIGQPALEREAQEQRRALGDRAVLAPRAPAPVHLRGQQLLGAVALRVQLLPRDVGLRIPLERLGALPQLPHVGHGRAQRQRIALLGDVGSGALLVHEHDGLSCRLRPSRARGDRRGAARDPRLANRSRTCAIGGPQDATLLRQRRGAEPVARRLLFRGQPRLAALLRQQPRVAIAGEDDVREEIAHGVDHRGAAARVQRGHAAAEERPREGHVARPVAGDEPERGAHHLVRRAAGGSGRG